MVRTAALIAAIVTAGSAEAADWRPVTVAKDGMRIELDVSSIQGEPSAPTAWFRFTYAKPDNGSASAKERYTAKCDDMQMRRLSGVENSADGKVLSATGPSPWADVIPDSTGEAMTNSMCYRP